jgi:type I restriction enzyme S subunit
MEEWKEYKLEEISCLSTGFPFKGNKYSKDGIRVVRGDNVTIGQLRWDTEKDKRWNEYFEREAEFSLRTNDIVIGMDGSRVGLNRAQIKEPDLPLLLAQRVACVRSNDKSIQKFLYYHIFSKRFVDYVKSIHTGTSIPHISLKQIGSFTIQLPPLATQQKIANILSSLDDKIEVNRRINEQLEELAQALFKSWFVDFEPFKDGEFVESELGMIPKGWKVGTLEDLIEIKYGKDHKKLNDGGIPVYGSGGIMRYVDKSLFTGESVLIPRKGTLNNVMYVNRDFWTVDTMFFSKMKVPNIAIFVYLFLSKKDLASMNSGSAVPSITVDILNRIQLVIPSDKVFEDYNNVVLSLFAQMSNNSEEITHLTNLRDTLLPKLMSGEIDVNEVEI